MAAAATRQTKAATIERTTSVVFNAEKNCIEATVCETHHKKTKSRMEAFAVYLLRRIGSDIGGMGVEIEKMDGSGDVYHVHLDIHGNSCTCPGGTYKGACRHLGMVREGVRLGLI